MDDCLALRQQLKEQFRAKLRKESGGGVKEKALMTTTDTKYGGFFGQSEVYLSERVIQEIQTCLRIPKSGPGQLEVDRKPNKSAAGSKTVPKMLDAVKKREKSQWLKDTRDYSFLSSDCEIIPTPGNNKPQISRPVEMTTKEIKGSKIQAIKTVSQDSRPPVDMKTEGSKIQARKRVSRPVETTTKEIKGSKIQAIKRVSEDSRPPVDMKTKGSKIQARKRVSRPVETTTKEIKGSKIQAIKRVSQDSRPPVDMKTEGSKIQARKRVSRPPEKTEQVSKNSLKKETKKNPCLKRKREEEEECKAVVSSLIRKMFRYDPTKFRDEDEKGDLNMEATFDDIQKEERRSTKIAKKEDDEELKKLMGIKTKNVKHTTD